MQAIKHKLRKATSTPKGKIIASVILFVIILSVTGGIIYWQTHKKKIIREQLEAAIEKKSAGLYNVKYETLDLDEITGYLSITNLTLVYDSSKYQAMKERRLIPPTLLKIHIPEITVKGVKTPRALLDKEIVGRKLEIKNPVIEIIYTMEGQDSSRHVPTKEVYEQILGGLNQISVDTVAITGAQIKTSNLKTNRTGIELNNVSVFLVDVKVDSVANADTTRLLFSKEIMIGCENLQWMSDNKLYKYTAKEVWLQSATNTVGIKSFSLDPQLGEEAFVKSLPTQDDRFDFSFTDIRLKNLDFRQLLAEEIMADSILIRTASFKIYRDLNIRRDKKNRVGTYPQQAVMKLPIPVHVKRLVLSNAFVEYKERNNITKRAGKVQFYSAYANISNLTNRKEIIAKDNTMNVDINTSFMNKTPFSVSWVFYLGNPNGRFDVKGKMGSLDAKNLNPLTEPMGPARIENGTIRSLDFNLKGNDYSMNGSVLMLYDNIKIALLEKDKGKTEWDKKSLTSFVANIMIKNSNPSGKSETPRSITTSNQRDTNRSIFHLTWKTLFKGTKETLGIKK